MMTIDDIARHRLDGWQAKEWVYISTIGELDTLGDVTYIQPAESYTALHGMSVMIVCSQNNPAQAYDIADQVLKAGALNLSVWVIEWNKVAELVCFGHRFQTPKPLPLSPEFKHMITQFSEALAA